MAQSNDGGVSARSFFRQRRKTASPIDSLSESEPDIVSEVNTKRLEQVDRQVLNAIAELGCAMDRDSRWRVTMDLDYINSIADINSVAQQIGSGLAYYMTDTDSHVRFFVENWFKKSVPFQKGPNIPSVWT
jgi:hypothetical protein